MRFFLVGNMFTISLVSRNALRDKGIAVTKHPTSKAKDLLSGTARPHFTTPSQITLPSTYCPQSMAGHVRGLVIQTEIIADGTLAFIKNAVMADGII